MNAAHDRAPHLRIATEDDPPRTDPLLLPVLASLAAGTVLGVIVALWLILCGVVQ
jgi:hypothetical protein